MRKALTIKLVILIIILLLLIGLLLSVLMGKGAWLDFVRINISETSYDETGYSIINGEVTVKESISDIEINYVSGSVDLIAYEGDTIIVTESNSQELAADDKARLKVEDGKLSIQFRKSRVYEFGITKTLNKSLKIKYPKKYACKDLNINVVSADTTTAGFSAANCTIENVSGNILISGGNFEKFTVNSVSGKVEVKGEEVGKIDAESVSGTTLLDCRFKHLSGESVSGSFHIKAAKLNGATAELDTVSGKVRGSVALTSDGDKYTFGDGSTEIDVETVSGDIIFE